jgi:hypothetical protein
MKIIWFTFEFICSLASSLFRLHFGYQAISKFLCCRTLLEQRFAEIDYSCLKCRSFAKRTSQQPLSINLVNFFFGESLDSGLVSTCYDLQRERALSKELSSQQPLLNCILAEYLHSFGYGIKMDRRSRCRINTTMCG